MSYEYIRKLATMFERIRQMQHDKRTREHIEVNKFLISELVDADNMRTAQCMADVDFRAQLTVEDALKMHREIVALGGDK